MKYSVKALMHDSKNRQECCICGKEFTGYGNNPWPVMKDGKCCDDCNFEVVLPARLSGTSKKIKMKDARFVIRSKVDKANPYTKNADERKPGFIGFYGRSWVAFDSDHIDIFDTREDAESFMKKYISAKYQPEIVEYTEASNVMDSCVKDSIKDLEALIASEKEAIELYTKGIKNAGDGIEKSIYEEILNDEKDHLKKLEELLKGYDASARIS